MSCNTCICPDMDCAPVLACLNDDLIRVKNGTSTSLENFCDAVAACVDAQFELVYNGLSNQLDNYGNSITKILQSLSGYSTSSDVYLYSTGGTVAWTAVSVGHTYVSSGTGITVTGNGSSSTPYTPSINTTYVKNLFSATNGLTYTSGVIKLGGTLIENTTIVGGSFNFSLTALDDFILESLGDTYLKIASYSGASSGDTLILANPATGLVAWRPAPTYSGQFIENQYLVSQSASYRINGFGFVGLKFTAGSENQITDTSHYFKGQAGDLYPFVIHNSSGSELLAVSADYLRIPASAINPTPALPAPFHEGSLYYNTSTFNFVGYHAGTWNNLLYDTRAVFTQNSIIGGGQLNTDLTIQLVNDVTTPDPNQYYGTNASGVKGWFDRSLGTVTSIDVTVPSIFTATGSPVTASGTIAITLNAVPIHSVLIGPTIGVTGVPTFRPLVTSDLPATGVTFDKIQNIATSRLVGRSSGGSGSIEELTLGSNLNLVSGVLNTYGRTLTNIIRFTSNGTWTISPGTSALIVYVVAGGGGGGAVSGTIAEAAAAGGGGGGAYTVNYLSSGFGTSQVITIGSGGTGGIAGNNDGSAGGSSSFGSLIIASGGSGGKGMAHGTTAEFAAGGSTGVVSTSTGLILFSGGAPGDYGVRLSSTVAASGGSGCSLFNGEAGSSTAQGIGLAGNAIGVGGSGAMSTSSSSFAGGNGLQGVVIIFEYS